ncbi:hypothetical protein [Peribacillus simplex]
MIKNSDPSWVAVFDEYQLMSEMQENKSAPKITHRKDMYSSSLGMSNLR